MINIIPALNHLGINSASAVHAVAQLRDAIEQSAEAQRVDATVQLCTTIFGSAPSFVSLDLKVATELEWAVTIAQYALQEAITAGGEVGDVPELFARATERAAKIIGNHKWMYTAAQAVAPAAEGEAIVAKREDGTIKKGGKDVASQALYKKHVLETTEPMTSQQFVALLMSELQMTKSGANTYAFNVRKKLGGEYAARVKKQAVDPSPVVEG